MRLIAASQARSSRSRLSIVAISCPVLISSPSSIFNAPINGIPVKFEGAESVITSRSGSMWPRQEIARGAVLTGPGVDESLPAGRNRSAATAARAPRPMMATISHFPRDLLSDCCEELAVIFPPRGQGNGGQENGGQENGRQENGRQKNRTFQVLHSLCS